MATTTSEKTASSTTTKKKESPRKRSFITGGVGRRTPGTLITAILFVSLTWFASFNDAFLNLLIRIGGSEFGGLMIILLAMLATGLVIFAFTRPASWPDWSKRLLAILGMLAAVAITGIAATAANSGADWLVLVATVLIVAAATTLVWLVDAADIWGWLRNKTDR